MRINPITESQIINIETQVKRRIDKLILEISSAEKILPVLNSSMLVTKRIVDKIAPLFPDYGVFYNTDSVHKYVHIYRKNTTNHDFDFDIVLCRRNENRVDVESIKHAIKSGTEQAAEYAHQLEILRRNLAVINALAEPINESLKEINDVMYYSHEGNWADRYTFSNNY